MTKTQRFQKFSGHSDNFLYLDMAILAECDWVIRVVRKNLTFIREELEVPKKRQKSFYTIFKILPLYIV